MADNLQISITADASKLRADLAVAQSQVRSFAAEMRRAADAARISGDNSGLQKLAGSVLQAESAVKRLKDELRGSGSAPIAESMTESFRVLPGFILRARESVGSLKEGLEAAAAAFAVERVAEWAKSMAEAGERAINTAQAVGLPLQKFLDLAGAMRLAGGDADMAGRALTLLHEKLQQAVEAPNSRQMDAFARLGFTWQQLHDALATGDVAPILAQMADAWVRMGDSANRTATFTQLFGTRVLQSMVPALRQGSAGLEEGAKRSREFGAASAEAARAEADTAEKMNALKEAAAGLSTQGFMVAKPAIDFFTEGLTNLIATGEAAIDMLRALWGAMERGGDYVDNGLPTAAMKAGGLRGDAAYAPISNSSPAISTEISTIMEVAGKRFANACAEEVNRALAAAGFATTGSNLAASFKTYGQSVAASQVRAGDVFYAGPSEGATGHVGITLGGVENGRVQVVSTHLQGAPGNPGGVEWRNAADLMFRRPVYAGGGEAGAPATTTAADYSFEAAKKAYEAELDKRKTLAEEVHDEAELVRLAQAKAAFEKMGPDQQRALMAQYAGGIGAATATQMAAGSKADAEVARTEEQARQYAIRTQLAQLEQQQDEARRRGDLATVAQIEAQKAAIVQANTAATAAEKIQAETRVRAAQAETAAQSFQFAEQAASAQQRANAEIEKGDAARRQAQVAGRELTPMQATQADIAEVQMLGAEEEAALAKLMQMADATGNLSERTRVYWQQWDLGVQIQQKVLSLQKQLADEAKKLTDEFAKPFKSALDSVSSSFENALTGLITRTTTWAKAWQEIDKAIIGAGVHLAGSVLNKVGGALLGGKPGEGVDDVIGNAASNWIGKQISGLLPNLAGNAAGSAAGSAAGAAAMTTAITTGGVTAGTTIGTAMTTAGATAASAIGAAMAAGGSSGGLLAGGGAAAGAGAALALFSRGGIVPSAAGGWQLPSFAGGQPAILHSREMVLPAHIADWVQNAAESGSGGAPDVHLHFHGPADGPSIQRWWRDNMMANADVLARIFRQNKLTPRTI